MSNFRLDHHVHVLIQFARHFGVKGKIDIVRLNGAFTNTFLDENSKLCFQMRSRNTGCLVERKEWFRYSLPEMLAPLVVISAPDYWLNHYTFNKY